MQSSATTSPKRDAPCATCVLNPLSCGYARPEGGGKGRITLVTESLGKQDAEQGKTLVGAPGYVLNRALQRAGIDRADLNITSVLRCQPPDGGKLWGTWYEQGAKTHCTFHYMVPFLKENTPSVLVALGATAFHALTDDDERGDYDDLINYPVWSKRFGCWIIPTISPSRILQGQFQLEPLLIYALERAVHIAEHGYEPRWGKYLLDPPAGQALAWAKRALESGNDIEFDIETPDKQHRGEDEILLRDARMEIYRISFSVNDLEGMSVPYRPEYMPAIKLLLESDREKGAWNKLFDVTVLQSNDQEVRGVVHDGMVAWHVLHSDLDKGLGFVAPFLVPEQPRWKHLGMIKPAFYNAVDSDVQRRARHRCWDMLKASGLWEVYERHVLKVDVVTTKMANRGMPQSAEARLVAAKQLEVERADVLAKLELVVDPSLRKLSPKGGFARTPKNTTGMREFVAKELVPRCDRCGEAYPKKPHFRIMKKKPNPCGGAGIIADLEDVTKYANVLALKLSPQLILAYQSLVGHPHIWEGRGQDRKRTTNENSLRTQLLKYTDDPFYPLVLRERKIKGIQGNFIGRIKDGKVKGGIKVSPDGLVHTTFTHKPSTLRMATENPGMHNHPRPGDPLSDLCRGVYIAPQGWRFVARDYKGIEAVLVGYFAGSRTYTWLAKKDIHTYTTAQWMHELGRLPYQDTPQVTWAEADLVGQLAVLKKRFPERQGIKVQTHAANYLAKSKMVQQILFDELGWVIPLKEVKRFLDFYKELFPEIPAWHKTLARQIDSGEADEVLAGLNTGAGYVRNPFGYVHRFSQVIRWEKVFGKWEWYLGQGANKAIAFPAQSTAAGIGKEALIMFDEEYPDLCDGPDGGLTLFAHDELLGVWRAEREEEVQAALKDVMERPMKCLPLDPSWEMGEYLNIDTDGKAGPSWGLMKEE